ncbi:MAG: DUF1835 domain-containing protein [Bacteroidota bacterium]|nr:DUF1835 domain-containing protein [Bacteroidota bacterium]
MVYHILNGDAIAADFPSHIDGKMIIVREAFVEGPVAVYFTDDFWEERKAYVNIHYQAEQEDYEEQFMSQLRLMDEIKPEDDVFLWFEDDLFCVVNMLFTISYITSLTSPVFHRVFPLPDEHFWKGFGGAIKSELAGCFENAIKLNSSDIELANQLWEAYCKNDREKLRALSFSHSEAFRFLNEVMEAHFERQPTDSALGRPQLTLVQLLNQGKTNFYEIYEEFWRKEAIYGFGDMQVYNMLKEMKIEFNGEPGD